MQWFTRLFGSKRVYLDYAARTPVRPHIAQMLEAQSGIAFGNPSAIHEEGRRARALLDEARDTVARILKVRTEEVIFTSGGTESNNLAIQGLLKSLLQSGRKLAEIEVVTTAIEHPSIREVLAEWKVHGMVVHEIPVDAEGLIDEHAFEAALNPHTALVTFAYANSEIGVVQDVKRLTRIVRRKKKEMGTSLPYVHLDASQAPLYLSCAVDSLGVDLLTLDAGKFYGPSSVGILMRRAYVSLAPVMRGGSQEEGLRPGTEHAPAIWGAAEAFRIAQDSWEARRDRTEKLRERCFERLLSIEGVLVNGSRTSRIANNVNISIPDIDGEYAAVVLDTQGIAISTKSACSGREGSGSTVIYALGGDDARALSTLRITLGEETTKSDIYVLVAVLKNHVAKTRQYLDQSRKK